MSDMFYKTYDEQIAYLNEHPNQILYHWERPSLWGPLFKKISIEPIGYTEQNCGCLTQIRNESDRLAYIQGIADLELTNEIRNDKRIPLEVKDITVDDLPIFKEWQERIDALQIL